MALVYSDIKSHFNMPELTLDWLMEILIVTGRKKARWGFSYGVDLQQIYDGYGVYPDYIRAIQGHQNVDARWLDTQELTEFVTGEVYHITDLKNVSGIKRHGVRPGGPTSKREMVHLSAGHPVHGHKEEPGKPIPNNYAYWGGNVYKDDRPDPVIITLDVKMLREREMLCSCRPNPMPF